MTQAVECASALQTWQRTRRRHKKLSSWENKHVLKCELDDAAVRKAKQKRRAPPVASVNQLAWSCDDMLVRHSYHLSASLSPWHTACMFIQCFPT